MSGNGVIDDHASSDDLPAITGTNYQFTTGTTFGVVSSYLPAHSATGINIDANIVLTFAARVKAGTGNIVLTPAGAAAINIAAGDAQVTYSTSAPWTATINPSSNFTNNKQYTITMASGVIKDHTDDTIHFAGISGTNYQFTTAAAAGGSTSA